MARSCRGDLAPSQSPRRRKKLRASIHIGEIEVGESDVRGLAVNEASRMIALAGSGDILVSTTTRQLAVDAGIMFEDRGEHDLRGLDGARRLYRAADPAG